jgi:hypothetical protein
MRLVDAGFEVSRRSAGVLTASFTGAAYEAIELTLTGTQRSEEHVEANSTL